MSYTKKAVKGFAIVFIISIIAAFLGYLIRIVMARNLSVEEYGLFFAMFTLMSLLAPLHSIGLSAALVKFIPEFLVKKLPRKISSSIFLVIICQVGTFVVFSLAALGLSGFLAEHYFKTPLAKPALFLFIVILLFSNLRFMVRSIYQAFQKMTTYAGMYLIENSLILILFFYMLRATRSIFTAIYSYIGVYIFIFIVFSIIFLKMFNIFKYKGGLDKSLAKNLFKFSIPVVLSGVGGTVVVYTDTLVLTYFRTLAEVGIYNVVVPTVMMLQFFGSSIASVIFPMVSELWTRKKKKFLESGLEILEKYTFVMLIPAVLVVFAFAQIILNLMFGPEYVSGALTLKILVIAILFLVMYAINSTTFSGIGRPEIATKILLQGAVINLVLNILIIPKLGIVGAALSSLITYLFIFLLSAVKLRKFIKIKLPWFNWFKIICSGLVMLALIFGLKALLVMNVYLEIIICGIIGGSVYLFLIWILRVVDFKEAKDLAMQIRK